MTALVHCPNPKCKHGQYVDNTYSEMNPLVGVWCDRCNRLYDYNVITGEVTLATQPLVALGWLVAVVVILGLAIWVASWYIPVAATMPK